MGVLPQRPSVRNFLVPLMWRWFDLTKSKPLEKISTIRFPFNHNCYLQTGSGAHHVDNRDV
ncbi:MAG: hypothetical protein M2R45_00935 [Verrucomicrobia subdivision 3 bacterium]|nr:hypothetical protein [Limisphaerales bacterium]MCS1414604.1 hypothetical protein [Limisphaerales bacterium]